MAEIKENRKAEYFSLSPCRDIEGEIYFEALDEKLNDASIRNIAITGTFGAGKSSVIESYIMKYKKDNFLRVSLANFCEENYTRGKEDEKKIEEQILQQLFYQLEPKDIPFSRFKSIIHFTNYSISLKVIAIIIWLFSILFLPNTVKLFQYNLQEIFINGFKNFFCQIYWLSSIINMMMLGIFCYGFYNVLRDSIIIIQKGQLKKIAMKSAEVELVENSALNKYIDELIYFFEASNKNVVIIEDLDRFNSIGLFSKLREINFIINNSPKIKHTIKFVYAISESVFNNSLLRTKFFDFILPIVPVINTTNSGDKLRKFLINDSSIPGSFINDISLYIHDLRLMKNIVNEYWIYNDVINNNSKRKGIFIFSLILYKNLFPIEFGLENSERGLLFKIFKERKNEILTNLAKIFENQIKEIESEKNRLYSEKADNEVSLRDEYLLEILKAHENVLSICNEPIAEISSSSEKFNLLFDNPKILIYEKDYARQRTINLDFSTIQKRVNKNTYNERLEVIKKREADKNIELNLALENKSKEMLELKRRKLSGLIKQSKDNLWKNLIFKYVDDKELSKEEELLALLLRKGYIDENYPLYMSYFYEGALKLTDFEYLLNVKNNEGNNFDSPLIDVNEVLNRISDEEFEYEATKNIYLITALLKRLNYKEDTRIDMLLGNLKSIEGALEKYIIPIIDHLKDSQKELQRFIELLVVRYYPEIWNLIDNQVNDETKKDELLKVFLFLSEENILKLNEASWDKSLKNYLETKANFIEVFNSVTEENIKKLIKTLNIKFQKLSFERYDGNVILNYIFQNNHYEINMEMLYLMLFNTQNQDQVDFDKIFYTQNFTCIYKSEQDCIYEYIAYNFNTYIEEVYAKLESKQNETEEAIASIVGLLDKENKDVFKNVFGRIATQIYDIEKFGNDEIWPLLFEVNSVKPRWENLIHFFKLFDLKLAIRIVDWLNLTSTYQFISLENLVFDNDDKEIITSLQKQIIESKYISKNAYESLIMAFPYCYLDINIKNLSAEKVGILVRYKRIDFNINHFEQILDIGYKRELLEFTIDNIKSYLSSYKEFAFDSELNSGLLKAKSRVSSYSKRSLFNLISIDNIKDALIANSMAEFLITLEDLFVENNKLIQIILKCNNQEIKLNLLDKYLVKLSFIEIDLILKNLGEEYGKASELRKQPKWKKNRLNLSIARKLEDKGYFRSIDTTDKGEIKIVVRYRE